MFNSKIGKIYFDLISEWTQPGLQSISNFPKSYHDGMFNFKISNIHANNRDFERMITYSIGEKTAFKIIDEGCHQILTHHLEKIKEANFEKPIKFNVMVQFELNYYNFVIAFTGIHSAILLTTINISKEKYFNLVSKESRLEAKGDVNYIVVLHDFESALLK